MELEVKYLAPYLPYGLRGITERNTIFELDIYSNMGPKIEKRDISGFLNNNIRPILRSLSDLDSLLKTNFEMLGSGLHDEEMVNLFCYENIGTDENLADLDITKLPYECVEYMFRNHYDVFGLIEKGLAVDINKVNYE
jgi:hypothetical protein